MIVDPAFFIVRGYTVTHDSIRVHRLGWSSWIPLADFQSAQVEPDAMAKAWRLLGNGGALAYTGFYRNGSVGLFRAFVTDPQRAVVVRTKGRTYVLSPNEPKRSRGSYPPLRAEAKSGKRTRHVVPIAKKKSRAG